jgi:hypothetical protein
VPVLNDHRLDDGIDKRITEVSTALQDAVAPILEQLVGPTQRAAVLARCLGIDKSLSGRILRSMKASDPFEVIHQAPAPYGLRIFLEAAAKAGINADLRGKAEESITRFESLIQTFPNGRASLEAAISDHIPEVRSRNERAAKQAVYKSMSYLLGYQSDASFQSAVLSPSDDGQTVDSMHISGQCRLRRLRGQAPMNLFGIRRYETQPGAQNWIETIDGRRGVESATEYLIESACSKPLPELTVRTEGDLVHTALSASAMPLNTPVTLVNGWVSRHASLRYRSEQRSHEWHAALLRIPTRFHIQDYYIHKDVYPGVTPEIQPRMHGLVVDRVRRTGPERQIDEIDLLTPVESFGMGIESPHLRNPGMPKYRDLLKQVFELAGLNPAEFRAYRCSIIYPVPFVSHTAWFELPPAP